jgi:alcohol dehydrogenase
VLEFSFDAATGRMAAMARMIGIAGSGERELAQAFLDAVRHLAAKVGISPTLPALQPSDIPAIARAALAEAQMNYPVPRYMQMDECEQLVGRLLARA